MKKKKRNAEKRCLRFHMSIFGKNRSHLTGSLLAALYLRGDWRQQK